MLQILSSSLRYVQVTSYNLQATNLRKSVQLLKPGGVPKRFKDSEELRTEMTRSGIYHEEVSKERERWERAPNQILSISDSSSLPAYDLQRSMGHVRPTSRVSHVVWRVQKEPHVVYRQKEESDVIGRGDRLKMQIMQELLQYSITQSKISGRYTVQNHGTAV